MLCCGVEMELNFRYLCNCGEKNPLTFNTLLDDGFQLRLNDHMNDVVDRAWDENDTDVLSQMVEIMNALRRKCGFHEDSVTSNATSLSSRTGMNVAILKTVCKLPSTCVCGSIADQVSTILDAGLAELSLESVREESILEKVQLLKPFVSMFQGETVLIKFLIRCWKASIRHYLVKLIEELTLVYPQFLETLTNALIESNLLGADDLTQRKEFKYLSRCLTVGPPFYTILSYLTGKNLNDVQHVITACITFVKAELPSKLYHALFPLHVRPLAVIMNEIIDPSDPNVSALLEDLKATHPLDYKILLMVSPVFYPAVFNK